MSALLKEPSLHIRPMGETDVAAVLAVGIVSSAFIEGTGLIVLVASMGASAVLLFATPKSPLAAHHNSPPACSR